MIKKYLTKKRAGFTLLEMALSKSFYFGQEKSRLLKRPLYLPVDI